MRFDRISPVFPVRDIDLAVGHCRKLGFAVRRYEGPDAYAFAERRVAPLRTALIPGIL
jgi:hypothetical protein